MSETGGDPGLAGLGPATVEVDESQEEGRPLSPSERRASLAAVIASAFAASLAFSISMPLLALILERRGVDTVLIGFNTAAGSLGLLLFTLVTPRLVSHYGTMRSLYLGFVLMILSIALIPVFDNVWAWFPLRFMMGMGIAIHWVVSETWINTVVDDRIRGRVMGIYVTALTGSYLAGMLVLFSVGSDGYLPFFLVSAAMSIAVLPIIFARNLAPGIKSHKGFGLIAAIRRAPATMTAALTDGFVMGGLFAFFLIYVQRMGYDEPHAILMLIAMASGNAALQYGIGMLADRYDRRLLLIVFALLVAGGMVLLPFALGNPLLLWPMLVLWGGTMGGIYTCGLALVGQRFRRHELPGANATFIFVYEAGTLAGPAICGIAMELWDPHGLIAATVTAGLLFSMVAAVRHIQMRGRDSA